MSAATLPDLRPGRELELVARHARPDDLADQGRVDAEVAEGLEQRLGGALRRLAGLALVRARAAQDAGVGEPVVGVLARRRVEEARRLRDVVGLERELRILDGRELVDEHRLVRRRVSDHVRVGLLAVDGRLLPRMAVGDVVEGLAPGQVVAGGARTAVTVRRAAPAVSRARWAERLEEGAEGGAR